MTRKDSLKKKLTRPILTKYLEVLLLLAQVCAATRRLIATHSVCFFAWYYLGVYLPWHQEFWVRMIIRSKRILILAPRNHGKTEVVSKILPLWLICKNRNIRILMVTKSVELARRSSMLIRAELEGNQRLINDWGAFYHSRESVIWQQATWQVVRSKKMKDPTFTAVGLFGAVTGNRCDILILDDVIDQASVSTPEQIAKVQREIQGTYFPLLEPAGQTFAIGTRKNFNDIYGYLLKSPGWTTIEQKAVLRMPAEWHVEKLDTPWIDDDGFERYERVVITSKDRGQVLWPELRTMEWCLEQKLIMGTALWGREMQNQVVDEETAMFPLKFLQQCTDESMSYIDGRITPRMRRQYLAIVAGCDPALVTTKADAERRDSDYMAMFAIGIQRDGTRDLLAIEHERGLSPAKAQKRMETFCKRIGPFRMAIEANAFGILHIANIIEQTDLPIIPHQTGLNKHDPYEGVSHMSSLFENLKFRLPYATDEDKRRTDALIAELHAFGSDVHDDQVMGLWITCYAALRYLAGQARLRKKKRDKEEENHVEENKQTEAKTV